MLSAINQEKHKSTIPSLNSDQRRFCWIFKNLDFKQWIDCGHSQVLWLSGPSEYSLHEVSKYVLDLENERLNPPRGVLYFFCSTLAKEKSMISVFIQTLLYQTISWSPMHKKISMMKIFLQRQHEAMDKTKLPSLFKEDDPPYVKFKSMLDVASADGHWTALKAVLDLDQEPELLIVIDGLDVVEHQKGDFLKGVREFVRYLRERKPRVKALLTSRPREDIKQIFNGFPCIEYDRERKG